MEDALAQAAASKKAVAEAAARQKLFQQVMLKSERGVLPAGEFGMLTYHGVLPLSLPDGLTFVGLPDLHIPAQHKPIMWAVKEFLADVKPHLLIDIGDLADMFSLSSWPVNPRTKQSLMYEVEETREENDELRRISQCLLEIVVMGNHDDRPMRYEKFVAQKLQDLVGLRSRQGVLAFHELLEYKPSDNIMFVYDLAGAGGFGGGIKLNDLIKLVHGLVVRPKPGASPRSVTDDTGESTMHGHTHRFAQNFREITRGLLRSYEIGNLVNPFHHMMSYANLLNNWHPGLCVGTIINGVPHIELLPIMQCEIDGLLRYVFVYRGKEYISSDR
jgi:hypothetical protein